MAVLEVVGTALVREDDDCIVITVHSAAFRALHSTNWRYIGKEEVVCILCSDMCAAHLRLALYSDNSSQITRPLRLYVPFSSPALPDQTLQVNLPRAAKSLDHSEPSANALAHPLSSHCLIRTLLRAVSSLCPQPCVKPALKPGRHQQ